MFDQNSANKNHSTPFIVKASLEKKNATYEWAMSAPAHTLAITITNATV